MASIFKRGGRKAPRDAPWYIAYSVRPGLRRTVKGCADYEATRALARKLEADAMLRRKGVVDERAEQWAAAEARPLAEHVADFAAALRAKGNTQKHVKGTEKLVKRVAELAKATKLSDLTPSRVQGALADLRATRLSLSRCNHALRAVKSFCRWLAADGRTPGNALAHLRGFNVKTDRRRVRRSLTDGELARLIRAARTGPDLMGASGSDRAALYCVALGTGFRANELRSLTRQSFALDADPPTITVEAGYSKRRRRDCQPIPPALAEGLRPWLADKAAGKPVFTVPHKTAKMLRADLHAAREEWLAEAATPAERAERERSDFLAYRDKAGRVSDFHSLRGAFVSRLIRGGVNVKQAQLLARHSTAELTVGVYADADAAELGEAVARLIPLPSGEASSARAAHGTAPMLPEPAQEGTECPAPDLDTHGAAGVSSPEQINTCCDVAREVTNEGPLAQWSERRTHNPLVGGPNPPGPTTPRLLPPRRGPERRYQTCH